MCWPPTQTRVMHSIENTSALSEEWLRSHGTCEAGAAQETLDWVDQITRHWVEQITRRLVAMRLANLRETTTQEEQRA
jgi:hypothetical protein